jgi:DNA-binding CsgD family transcriptional regulator
LEINGARRTIVDEPLACQRIYQVEWVAPRVNLRELALLRFIQGKTERELAQYFGRSKTAIHELLVRMVKNDFKHANLSSQERELLKWKS